MAVRREDLYRTPDALVVDFPIRVARARARRARHSFLARRIAALALAAGLVAGVVSASAAGGDPIASRPGAPASVVIQPGETVWDLAQRYVADGSDPRAYADEIIALNGVSGVAPPGTLLHLP